MGSDYGNRLNALFCILLGDVLFQGRILTEVVVPAVGYHMTSVGEPI